MAIKCSFCGKSQAAVARLIEGQKILGESAYACNECIETCYDMILKDTEKNNVDKYTELPTPDEIKKQLDEHVIGQEFAKKILSVAVYNHYRRIESNADDGIEIQKSNVLMLGPTGTGKTLLVQTLAKILKVPLSMSDATALTEAGYVGEDVESIVTNLLQNAEFDVKLAEKGIIYIDEIDKIVKKNGNTSTTRDVGGEGVQQGLLKILEGSTINVSPKHGRRNPNQEFVKVNTSHILFICGGAFTSLAKVITERKTESKRIGFGAVTDSKYKNKNAGEIVKEVEPEDLIMAGLIPEFVGRIPVTATLHNLDKESLLKILVEPKNSLTKQYAKLFKMNNLVLTWQEDALSTIADKALAKGNGARGLRSIIERAMLDLMYNAPSYTKKGVKEIIITADVIEREGEPVFVYNEESDSTALTKV